MADLYVDATLGSDGAAGTSELVPWQTISKVNAASLSPGDSVLFKRGEVWREKLTVPDAGSSGSPITFGADGEGADPIISAGVALTSWTQGAGLSDEESGGLFATGLEVGDLTDFTSTQSLGSTTIEASTDEANSGTYSLKMTGDGTGNLVNAIASFAEMEDGDTYYFRWRMKVDAADMKASSYLRWHIKDGGSDRVQIQLATDGSRNITSITVNRVSAFATILSGASISNWTMGAWNTLEVAYKVDSSVGGAQVWVNGTSVGSNFTVDTSNGIGVDQVQIGNYASGQGLESGGELFYDDIKVADSGPIGEVDLGVPTTVWYATAATQPHVATIGGSFGTEKASVGTLGTAGDWFWAENTFYTYSVAEPTDVDVGATLTEAILIDGVDYITIEGIHVRTSNGRGIRITNSADFAVMDSVIVEQCYQEGIRNSDGSNSGSDGILRDSTLRYNGASGFVSNTGSDNWTVSRVEAHNNGWVPLSTGIYQFTGGIKFFDATDVTIDDCYAHDNGFTGCGNHQGVGLWLDICTTSIVKNSRSFDNLGYGVFNEKGTSCEVYNNLIINSGTALYGAGLAAKASEATDAIGNKHYNNTIVGGYWCIYSGEFGSDSEYSNNEFTNNIAINSDNGVVLYTEGGGANDGDSGSTGNVYVDNCFGPEATNFIRWDDGTGNVSTYAAWEAAYGSTTNSVEADPLLVDDTGSTRADFKLTGSSPCIGAGVDVGLTTDAFGNPWLDPPDIGAHSYSGEVQVALPGTLSTAAKNDALDGLTLSHAAVYEGEPGAGGTELGVAAITFGAAAAGARSATTNPVVSVSAGDTVEWIAIKDGASGTLMSKHQVTAEGPYGGDGGYRIDSAVVTVEDLV